MFGEASRREKQQARTRSRVVEDTGRPRLRRLFLNPDRGGGREGGREPGREGREGREETDGERKGGREGSREREEGNREQRDNVKNEDEET